MFSSPGEQGSCSWSLTGNRCGGGGSRGEWRALGGWMLHRSELGGWGGRNKAAPLRHGALGTETPSPPLSSSKAPDCQGVGWGCPVPTSPIISLREKTQVRSTWSPGEEMGVRGGGKLWPPYHCRAEGSCSSPSSLWAVVFQLRAVGRTGRQEEQSHVFLEAPPGLGTHPGAEPDHRIARVGHRGPGRRCSDRLLQDAADKAGETTACLGAVVRAQRGPPRGSRTRARNRGRRPGGRSPCEGAGVLASGLWAGPCLSAWVAEAVSMEKARAVQPPAHSQAPRTSEPPQERGPYQLPSPIPHVTWPPCLPPPLAPNLILPHESKLLY